MILLNDADLKVLLVRLRDVLLSVPIDLVLPARYYQSPAHSLLADPPGHKYAL